MKVKLSEIADCLEMTMQNWEQYYNKKTGEFVALPDCDRNEEDEMLAEKIEMSDNYIRLPNQYEIDEFSIMVDFAESLDDEEATYKLSKALNGRKPFRHFKDEIFYLGIREEYFAFQKSKYLQIAENWCKENNIEYIKE